MIRHDLGWEEIRDEDELEQELLEVMDCITQVNRLMNAETEPAAEEALEEKLDELRIWKQHVESKIESRNESRCGL